jgi:hypothetical protein
MIDNSGAAPHPRNFGLILTGFSYFVTRRQIGTLFASVSAPRQRGFNRNAAGLLQAGLSFVELGHDWSCGSVPSFKAEVDSRDTRSTP